MRPLPHLNRPTARKIGIVREVIAEIENPVMFYRAGMYSSVMLHLARKAFYPAQSPFRRLNTASLAGF